MLILKVCDDGTLVQILLSGHYPSSCLYMKTPVYFSKHKVLETGFCLRLQVNPNQLGPIDRDISGQESSENVVTNFG
jgi:hypothetical protein